MLNRGGSMKVIVATKNEAKIEGARNAFSHYFDELEVIGIPAESDVSGQPLNEEILQGAENRVSNLKKHCIENNISADLYVSVESGITDKLGEWLIINAAVIEDNDDFMSYGFSSGFPVPNKYVDDILKIELAGLMSKIFGDGKRNTKGGISFLTDDLITRPDISEQAFVMALISYNKNDIWSDVKLK
jgi:inosine/xanthosine triphosphatase